MKFKHLLQFSALIALLVSGLGSNLTAKAAPQSDIIDRNLTYWDATYTGYVDATRFEKWQFVFGQTYTFTVTAIQSSGNLIPLVRLLDVNGNEISTQTGTLTSTQPAGTYSILILPFSGNGTYNLTIRQINTSTSTPTVTAVPVTTTRTTTPTTVPITATRTTTSTAAPATATRTTTPTTTPITSTQTTTSTAIAITATRTSTATTIPISSTPITATVTQTNTAAPATTTSTPTAISTLPNVSIILNPANINVNGNSAGTVNLNNPPVGGYTSAEFTCTYNPALIQVSNFVAGNLFGANPVMVVNGPANGSFIIAIAGSNGNEATASGIAFTFSIQASQAGQATIQCTVRVSNGSDTLTTIPSTPTNLTITSAQGNLVGQVLASKPVTVSLYNPNTTLATSAVVNSNGSFNLSAVAGTYTVIASAEGYLEAQGAPTITTGGTTTMKTVILIAGDIDNNNVINQLDAMTIGMNYNLAIPTAADLNNDGTINILDLELLASNYGASGSLAWLPQ